MPPNPEDQREQFLRDGFIKIPQAFPRAVADEARAILWQATGYDPDDPGTWAEPAVRLGGFADEPFRVAANTDVLHTAFDTLAGPGRWQPRESLGTFPVRFPHSREPDDTGWHVEASFAGPDGQPALNLRSHGRALLMLFLFSEVGEDDAPTVIRTGSHLDVPPLLEPFGEQGVGFFDFAPSAIAASEHRPVASATGHPGDVYLCHPFVVHGGQPHHGQRPKFMAQPPLEPTGDLELDRADGAYSAVEEAVRLGLGLAG